MLFSTSARTYDGPKPRSEPHYAYLNRSARPEAGRIRDLLEDWFTHYPARERNRFIAEFRSKRQFVAASFELYLHELLLRLGYKVEVHPENPTGKPSRPDFRATCPVGSRLYVEAVVANDMSNAERTAEARTNAVLDKLDELQPSDFTLGVIVDRDPSTPPPIRRMKELVQNWLEGLDVGEVVEAYEGNGNSALPKYVFEHEGWRIELIAWPRPPTTRGCPEARPVGFEFHSLRMISTWRVLRDAIIDKGKAYGALPDPLVIAVNAGGFGADTTDVVDALYGRVQYQIATGVPRAEPTATRARNGAWTSRSEPRYRRISGVLVAPDVMPWSVAASSLCIHLNPWSHGRCDGPILSLPRSSLEGDDVRFHGGVHPRELLGLDETWPYRFPAAAPAG